MAVPIRAHWCAGAESFGQETMKLFTGRHGYCGGRDVLFRSVSLVSSNHPSRNRVKATHPVKPLQGNNHVGEMRRGLNSLVISTREGANRIVRLPLHLLF
jgi:hypothetical protein